MKILILSDSHGATETQERIVRKERPDHILHLGDHQRDAETLARTFPMLPICTVPGNNDFLSDEPKEKAILLSGTRIFLCHGHTAGVRSGYDGMWVKARQRDCSVALFGHTHAAYLNRRDGILLLNPGSVRDRDQYAILTLTPGKEPEGELKSID